MVQPLRLQSTKKKVNAPLCCFKQYFEFKVLMENLEVNVISGIFCILRKANAYSWHINVFNSFIVKGH